VTSRPLRMPCKKPRPRGRRAITSTAWRFPRPWAQGSKWKFRAFLAPGRRTDVLTRTDLPGFSQKRTGQGGFKGLNDGQGVPALFVGAPLRVSTNRWRAELIPFRSPRGISQGDKPDTVA